jgi:hypothetical protein
MLKVVNMVGLKGIGTKQLIAPCGMNCGICSSYLALKNDVRSKGIRIAYCTGCRQSNRNCGYLKKRCDLLANGKVTYCYECDGFPCNRLQHLDNRYRSLFRMSMIENLETIKRKGINGLLAQQTKKWKCPECGGVVSCHNGVCFECGVDKMKSKSNLLRWED